MERFNLAKYIAHCGVCSRRDAEELITNNRVMVNKRNINDLAFHVSEADLVSVNGININLIDEPRIFILNKPKGFIVSARDEKNRKTVFSLVPKSLPRLITIGRLDYNSEGVLLMTNYGPLARYFELPQNNIERVYHVKIFGEWKPEIAKELACGMTIDGISYQPVKVRIISKKLKQVWLEVTLTEGKNREIRKIFTHFGFLISKLRRIQYGNFSLGTMQSGQLTECKKHTVSKLMEVMKNQ